MKNEESKEIRLRTMQAVAKVKRAGYKRFPRSYFCKHYDIPNDHRLTSVLRGRAADPLILFRLERFAEDCTR